MIHLSTQLKNDYIELFESNEDYNDIIVKEKYETYPKISYPMITIDEITNEDVNQYFEGTERISYLVIQIEIAAEQSEEYTANQNIDRIADIIDGYMKGDRYRCMRRLGDIAKTPLTTDKNVMCGYLRYECYVDIKTNTIYRRY